MKNKNRNTTTYECQNYKNIMHSSLIKSNSISSYSYDKVNIHNTYNSNNLILYQKQRLDKIEKSLSNYYQKNQSNHHTMSRNQSFNKIQFNRNISPKSKFQSYLSINHNHDKQNQKNIYNQNYTNNIKNSQVIGYQNKNYQYLNNATLNKSNSINQFYHHSNGSLFQDISNFNNNHKISISKLQQNIPFYSNNHQNINLQSKTSNDLNFNSSELLQITFKNQNFLEESSSSNSKLENQSSKILKNFTHQDFYQHLGSSFILNQSRQKRISHQVNQILTKKNSHQKKTHKRFISNMTERIKKAYNQKDSNSNLHQKKQKTQGKVFIQHFRKIGKQSRGSLIRCLGQKDQKKMFQFHLKKQNSVFSSNKYEQKSLNHKNIMLNTFQQSSDLSSILNAHKSNFKLLKKHQRSYSNVEQMQFKHFNDSETKQKQNIRVQLAHKQSNIQFIVPQTIEQSETQFSTKNKINLQDFKQKASFKVIDNQVKKEKPSTYKLLSNQQTQNLIENKSNSNWIINKNLMINQIQRKHKRTYSQMCAPQSFQSKNYLTKQNISSQQKTLDRNFNSKNKELQNSKITIDLLKQNLKNSNNIFTLKSDIAISLGGDQQKIQSTVIHDCQNDDLLRKIGNNTQALKLNFKSVVTNSLDLQNQPRKNFFSKNKQEKQQIKYRRSKLKSRGSQVSILSKQNSPRQGTKSVKFGEENLSNKEKSSIYSIKTMSRFHIPNQYQKGKFLGKGYFGQVFVGKHLPTGMLCALKYLKLSRIKQQKMEQSILRQIKCQIALNHPNICKIYQFFYDKTSDSLVLVVEFCQGKELYHLMKEKRRMNQQQAAQIIHQLALAIQYMHKKHVIHRDLKPENIMISQGVVKLCDFGWAIMTTGPRKTMCGTPLYSSPQIVLGKQYDKKVDLWGLGVLTYEMLIGLVPFKVYGQHQLHKIAQDQVAFPQYVEISLKAKDFISRVLNKDPDQRLDIFQIIEHPFLQRRKRVIQRVSIGYPQFAKILLSQ